ncbi:uncharacterized protein TNIN_162781 [Trichonephila inaurata madagascariensis]|uniref:Uncharacterized protein n=1 Tax=Trichonephila inaurata madagascariensis TaxID=2747483 RepID=A0A8X6YB30_9ARAC|nr:uncharacterized protein TNIN_162781 [Trichonephila inaurata madagascariensis]
MSLLAFLRFLITTYAACYGSPDIPYLYEVPSCTNELEERDVIPFYDSEKRPFDQRLDSLYDSTPTSLQSTESWILPKNEGADYLNGPQTALNRKKRSLEALENAMDGNVEYEMAFYPSLLRPNRNDVKTIHLPSSFTPRLGKKRSDEKMDRSRSNDAFHMGAISGRSHVINLNAGNAFTPRLGRAEGSTKIHLNAGGAFTPRFGRSEDRIRLKTGNAFTPRLGIRLNAGGAFTPRLGRSENLNRITLNAGSTFTPRLG